jgi:hypothetical protein
MNNKATQLSELDERAAALRAQIEQAFDGAVYFTAAAAQWGKMNRHQRRTAKKLARHKKKGKGRA